jgi:FMN phosphatase YigB (HAD superfamily)
LGKSRAGMPLVRLNEASPICVAAPNVMQPCTSPLPWQRYAAQAAPLGSHTSSEAQMRSTNQAIFSNVEAYDLVSTDCFDTLLLRDNRSEWQRLAAIARRTVAALAVYGHRLDAPLLLSTRTQAQKLAYRALEAVEPAGDVTLDAILRLQARMLQIDPELAAVMADCELQEERVSLQPNAWVIDRLEAAAQAGKRVIAVSDTYLPADALRMLAATIIGAHPVMAFYSSADIGLTKRGGGLFDFVAEREGVAPARILHIGDHGHADVTMARRAGLQAAHLPRPLSVMLKRLGSRISFERHAAGMAQ